MTAAENGHAVVAASTGFATGSTRYHCAPTNSVVNTVARNRTTFFHGTPSMPYDCSVATSTYRPASTVSSTSWSCSWNTSQMSRTTASGTPSGSP